MEAVIFSGIGFFLGAALSAVVFIFKGRADSVKGEEKLLAANEKLDEQKNWYERLFRQAEENFE